MLAKFSLLFRVRWLTDECAQRLLMNKSNLFWRCNKDPEVSHWPSMRLSWKGLGRSFLMQIDACSLQCAWTVVYRRGLWMPDEEEETRTAGHRWGCGSTGPHDQDSFNMVWACTWYIHVVSEGAIFTEWLYGSDLVSFWCSDRIHYIYRMHSKYNFHILL